ncbi:hypothetical protein ACRDNQ_11270 [Palleronia sp. KMU-117]|uniref:hypothetical protein n=1 Tax=Palleronia sp. KMU-117 TaxID=3434108 RepID=UPI003D73E996
MDVRAADFDLNKCMIAENLGQCYFGPDCMHLPSLVPGRSGFVNRTIATILSRRSLARRLYSFLRSSRSATLCVLGRSLIA